MAQVNYFATSLPMQRKAYLDWRYSQHDVGVLRVTRWFGEQLTICLVDNETCGKETHGLLVDELAGSAL